MDTKALCKYCAAEFDATRTWQLFCGARCRGRYNRENSHCFYCGDPATARDHVEPVSIRGNGRHFEGVEYVRSCTECNAWLGDQLFNDLAERVSYIAFKLYSKYRLDEKQPVWAPSELRTMGPNMQHRIKKSLADWAKRRERYEYATAVCAMLEADNGV